MKNEIESKKYMLAKNYLEMGSKNIENNDFISAISNYKKGLEELGYCYTSKNFIDDTGNWITIAKIEEREKRYSNAATILRRMLTTRLNLYEEKKEKPTC